MTFDPGGADAGHLRVELTFLDAAVAGPSRAATDPEFAEDLFTSPLLPITPWEWDWFD